MDHVQTHTRVADSGSQVTHESSPTPDVPAAEWSGNSAALGEERATGVHSSMAKVTVVRM